MTQRDDPDPAARPLFLFPGLAGEAAELEALAERLGARRPVVLLGRTARGPQSLPQMAAEAVAHIRARQPHGPCRLIGYSFGGLIAFEAARLLAQAGEPPALTALIDAPYDERYWPVWIWLRSQGLRTVGHLAALRAAPPHEAVSAIGYRARRLLAKALGRVGGEGLQDGGERRAKDIGRAAMARWRPGFHPGVLTLFNSEAGTDFHCDVARLWRGRAAAIETQIIPAGGHLGLVRQDGGLEALAAAIEARLDDLDAAPAAPSPAEDRPPRVLVATTVPWLSTARLGLAFRDAGCTVEALCPLGHALAQVEFVSRVHRQDAFAPQRALRRAIAAAEPDLIVPCDDRAASQLHSLFARLSPLDRQDARLRALIARSIGEPANFPMLHRRALMMALAEAEGVRRLETVPAPDRAALDSLAYPAVLKTDGSWGGQGVAIVQNLAEARRAYARLSRPPGLLRAAKRLLLDRDVQALAAWLRRERPAISVQRFVRGQPANAAVACWRGEVLAMTAVEAIRTADPTGHATAVRHVDNAGMALAAARLARRLNLSGLFGLDFILDAETGEAQLIEINPRATPTAHLTGLAGVDPITALAARLGAATPPRGRPTEPGEVVALFPHEMIRDARSPLLTAARHDVPWSSPALVRLGLRQLGRRRPVPPGWVGEVQLAARTGLLIS
jgi:thioesterase domain-containing protein